MTRPNFFIIGAPKCGTSSLFSWLAQHPDIAATSIKEPFLLMDPEHPLAAGGNGSNSLESDYRGLFKPFAHTAKVRMEGTTHYLFQKAAIRAISQWADAKVAVVLREPASRVYSSFSYTKNNLARLKSNLCFQDYLDLIDAGESLYPRWCSHRGSAFVLERDIQYSAYASYLRLWLDAIGKSRVFPIVFELMRESPTETIESILEWLTLDKSSIERIDSRPRNETVTIRSQAVQRALQVINRQMRFPAPVRRKTKKLINRFQATDHSVSDDDRKAIARLRLRFYEDNKKLEGLLNIDLSHWNNIAKPEARKWRA